MLVGERGGCGGDKGGNGWEKGKCVVGGWRGGGLFGGMVGDRREVGEGGEDG